MHKIEEYANEIPEEVRRAISALDDDFRAAIFVALLRYGELSFSEICKLLDIDKAKLNYHLSKLTEGALVEHHYRHELGVDKYSFYSTTKFGSNFVQAMIDALKPEPIFTELRLRGTIVDASKSAIVIPTKAKAYKERLVTSEAAA